ncbi:MAG TPA: dynamin family protein [Candidatus Acidoferrales bacterium]|nr:dynamin family protein [Candidatus Acidoferrales bacterium]
MSGLNENQARRLRVSCQYIDRLLGEIEAILNAAGSGAAFPQYVAEVRPAARRTMEDYIARIRAQLRRVLDGQGIEAPPASIPAARAVRANLTAIDIAVEELKPGYMAGFGEVSAETAVELNGIAGELRGLVARLDRYVAEGEGGDLRARLEQLERAGADTELAVRIEEVVRRRGLVEFRAPIANLLDRMADTSLEIAVFGRVSSGKSSLLNALLGIEVLPVGVTPVTSVPTRLAHGKPARVTVRFAERPAEECGVERLAEFVTEQENAANRKNVTRVSVRVPSARLAEGVVFVDTPGLGGLARAGAAETLAYLPKCDFGVVLMDAASPLTGGDLETVRALADAGISACVLVSKADLLSAGDLERVTGYVREQLAAAGLGELPVAGVSVQAGHREGLERWFAETITPLYGKARELREASLRRKAGVLRESVAAALRARLPRRGGDPALAADAGAPRRMHDVEARLRMITGRLEELPPWCEREGRKLLAEREQAYRAAAARVMEAAGESGTAPAAAAREALVGFVHERVQALHDRLQGFAREMAAELRAAAVAVGMADAPENSEFAAGLRDSPAFDFPEFEFRAGRSPLAGLGGRRMAERRLAGRLEREMGEKWTQALATYVALLDNWSRSVARQWAARFDAYAAGYRAQAQREAEGLELSAEEARALAADLEALGGRGPGAGEDAAAAATSGRASGKQA